MVKFGFIGAGNMAGAIAKGAAKAGYFDEGGAMAFDINGAATAALEKEYGIKAAANAAEVVGACDIVLLGVKPNVIKPVIDELGDLLVGKAVVCIALGWRKKQLDEALPKGVRVQSVMPNTPCLVSAGMTLFEAETSLTADELDFVKGMFERIGKVEILDAKVMGPAGTLTGCGPAFAYMFVEALADGAVYHGVPRDTAYRLAAQMLMGSAKMVLESGMHPGALKDSVCSPGGSTIRGVDALEKGAFRATVMNAIHGPETYGK